MWEPGLSGRRMGIYTTFDGSQFHLWRAGLSCVGLRSSP